VQFKKYIRSFFNY